MSLYHLPRTILCNVNMQTSQILIKCAVNSFSTVGEVKITTIRELNDMTLNHFLSSSFSNQNGNETCYSDCRALAQKVHPQSQECMELILVSNSPNSMNAKAFRGFRVVSTLHQTSLLKPSQK